MNNNINNGVSSTVNGIQNAGTIPNNVSNVSTPVAQATTVNNGVTNNPGTNVYSGNTVGSTPKVVTAAQPTTVVNAVPIVNSVPVSNPTPAVNNSINSQDGIATNTYVIVGCIVGFVILAAVFLLVLLVTGVIGDRNRLYCSKTVNENGYIYTEHRTYRFDNGPYYTRIEKVFTFDYANLTDDIYNETFSGLIDNENAVSTYGFDSNINRNGNIVTITSYEPKIFDRTVDEVLSSSKNDGFICD